MGNANTIAGNVPNSNILINNGLRKKNFILPSAYPARMLVNKTIIVEVIETTIELRSPPRIPDLGSMISSTCP